MPKRNINLKHEPIHPMWKTVDERLFLWKPEIRTFGSRSITERHIFSVKHNSDQNVFTVAVSTWSCEAGMFVIASKPVHQRSFARKTQAMHGLSRLLPCKSLPVRIEQILRRIQKQIQHLACGLFQKKIKLRWWSEIKFKSCRVIQW